MEDLDKSLKNIRIREAKRFSLDNKVAALRQLILQRFQMLTTISAISFAVAGIVISFRGDFIQNWTLAIFALVLFVTIAFIGLGRHLFLLRSDIKKISQKIKELPAEDWSKPLQGKEFKADWWPETLYVFLVIATLLFGLSFLNCSYT